VRAVIVPYAGGDTAGIRDLILDIQQREFGFPITWEDQPDLHDIPGFYRAGAGEFWVAKDEGGRVVGMIGLRDIGGGLGALRKMFVAKEWRGAGGAAHGLLDTLIAHARERGFRAIVLGTTEAFHAAHRFYEKSGFRRVEGATLPGTFPRMKGDTRFYRFDLA
jgi:N-acetylglutamate synthase-like GNAT family acetyltransferase